MKNIKQLIFNNRMKSIITTSLAISLVLMANFAEAQKNADNERMTRDIEVSENVLATLIKQQMDGRRMFFPLEIQGSYQPGFGVTFTIPADYTTPIVFSLPEDDRGLFIFNGRNFDSRAFEEQQKALQEEHDRLQWRLKDKQQLNMDSLHQAYNLKLIEACKSFIADYGDMLSQIKDDEKIVITNRGGEQPRIWINQLTRSASRSHLSVEVVRKDISHFKQGKLTRDELLKKIKIVNAQTIDEVDADLELLSSIFNRLYRPDLSKTYFSENSIYYERLRDFGAVYYMQMYSSNRAFDGSFEMPTINVRGLTLEERDQKVRELYPAFEKELKENIIEYGRTVKSLSDDEVLMFSVKVTRCDGCNIPASLEVSVKGSVLKDYNAGKLNKDQALNKMEVKKGGAQ